jgi:DNA-directed RNA polymerase sigma subunit (sigma70/sigma32)
VDPDLISALLREHLSPWQEKVVRLYFGLGCAESHPAAEIAQAFGVSRQMISGTVRQAQSKLTPVGLTPGVLREAGRLEAMALRKVDRQPVRHRCQR